MANFITKNYLLTQLKHFKAKILDAVYLVESDVQSYAKTGSGIVVEKSVPSNAVFTYPKATETESGLMSSADKKKLDGIASGANNYSLPTASSTTLGGIKVGTNLSISNGVLSATGTTYESKSAASGGTDVSLVTTGEKYTWNNKLNATDPTGTGSFSMNRKAGSTIGNYSSTLGNSNIASGVSSYAEGFNTIASGGTSHAEGQGTTASGSASHAEGFSTIASKDYSHAEGYCTLAGGKYSHAEGYYTTALGENSHIEGCSTYGASSVITDLSISTTDEDIITAWNSKKFSLAKGKNSHAEGINCLALGDDSHAEGSGTIAKGTQSHAEGYNTTASGIAGSHAEGWSTTARGQSSHAEGYNTTASNFASHSSGKYNADMEVGGTSVNTTGTAFVIGNGTTASAKSNAFSVQYNGTVKAKSTITASTTADYAEFFEWLDENPNNEDRVGKFVTLEGDKIKIASNEDDYILGIISGEPFVLGNGDCDVWNGMYLHDKFRRTMTEPAPKTKEILDENGNPTGNFEEIEGEYEGTRFIVNPDYDPSRKYISRFERKEWSAVGMLGVLPVYHDGTAKVNEYVTVNKDGIATACDKGVKNSYRVIKENDTDVVEIIFR